jgi:pimeloyl-ACP methyl ester carboxylesterase
VVVLHWAGHPRLLAPLQDDLARDHRVVLYHPRGNGDSTRAGPYDLATDSPTSSRWSRPRARARW